MLPNDFGIYIVKYPGDFHLSSVLVRSIQEVSPNIPIMIIPGEGLDFANHPFNVPIMPEPTQGFWPEIGHQGRDFLAFQGPFETFLYLDADTLCVKSLDRLADRITRQQGPFIYAQRWAENANWIDVIQDPSHPDQQRFILEVRSNIGTDTVLQFDPDFDLFAHKPFNSGVFASRRLTVGESELESLNRAEQRFYREVLNTDEWTWKSSDLFFRDQGRLNYLAHKLSITIFPIEPELNAIPGASAVQVSFENVKNDTCDFHIIHWMGSKTPSPSFFCIKPLLRLYALLWSNVAKYKPGRWKVPGYERLQECTGYSLWKYYYERELGKMPLGMRLRWSWPDLRKTFKLCVQSLRLLFRSINK